MKIIPEINNRLREFRETTGLNQKEFSKLIGVNNSYYSDIENARRKVTSNLLAKIQKHYEISGDWIFTGIQSEGIVNHRNNTPINTPSNTPKIVYLAKIEEVKKIWNDKVNVELLKDKFENAGELKELISDCESACNDVQRIIEQAYFSILNFSYSFDNEFFANNSNFIEYRNKYIKQIEKLAPMKSLLEDFIKFAQHFEYQFKELDKEKILGDKSVPF